MSKHIQIQKFENERLKKDIPEFSVGDTIRVHTRILEEGGKERLQMFAGTVVAYKGSGISKTVSVHRIAYGEGMERVVYIHSPLVAKIELIKRGKVRRSKLYYLRGSSGKKAKVKGRFEAEKAVAAAEHAHAHHAQAPAAETEQK